MRTQLDIDINQSNLVTYRYQPTIREKTKREAEKERQEGFLRRPRTAANSEAAHQGLRLGIRL